MMGRSGIPLVFGIPDTKLIDSGRLSNPMAIADAISSAPSPGGLSINHPTLAAVVAQRLRQLINDPTLRPGTWLTERHLCEKLKIYLTALRVAYRMLSSYGLLALHPKRGANVVEL